MTTENMMSFGLRRAQTRDNLLTLLGSAEEHSILLERKVNFDQLSTSQKLHDHSGCQDRGDTEFHQRSSVTCENDSHPVQRVGGIRGHDSVEGYLGHDQEDQKGGGCP